ncbi:MAG: DUF2269 family protein [Actinomycetota bacterium]
MKFDRKLDPNFLWYYLHDMSLYLMLRLIHIFGMGLTFGPFVVNLLILIWARRIQESSLRIFALRIFYSADWIALVGLLMQPVFGLTLLIYRPAPYTGILKLGIKIILLLVTFVNLVSILQPSVQDEIRVIEEIGLENGRENDRYRRAHRNLLASFSVSFVLILVIMAISVLLPPPPVTPL